MRMIMMRQNIETDSYCATLTQNTTKYECEPEHAYNNRVWDGFEFVIHCLTAGDT